MHLFAPLDGPYAAEAYAEVRGLWHRCRQDLGMGVPLSPSVPSGELPPTLDELSRSARPDAVLTAQKHPVRLFQAILRRFPAVLNLSVLLSPGVGADRAPDAPGWSELEREWASVAGPWSGYLIGEATLLLGKAADGDPSDDLARLSLPDAPLTGWWSQGVTTAAGVTLWEPDLYGVDERPQRTFVVLAAADRDDPLSSWTWSDGTPAIPPFGRYLLHAAAVRYQLRAWQAADDLRRVQERLSTSTPQELPGIRTDLAFWTSSLEDLRLNLANAAADMRSALGTQAADLERQGPFADDLGLIPWITDGISDDLSYLRNATERARTLGELSPPPSGRQREEPVRMRNPQDVFVIHGRDEEARVAVFDVLRSIGLHPLDWEEIVASTGSSAPYLAEVLEQAFEDCQAAVVVLTPDDGASLHPSLHDEDEEPHERNVTGQPRPNVLLEAGMALALQRDRTLLIQIGRLRGLSDLNGLNFVKFDGTVRNLQKIASRLESAGCAVRTKGTDWLDVRRYQGLDAYTRTF